MFEHSWNSNVSATLLLPQGELIDLIERNVESAGIYVHRGQVNLKSAVVYKSKGRKVSVDTIINTVVFLVQSIIIPLFPAPFSSFPPQLKWIICCVVSSVVVVLLILAAIIAGIGVYCVTRMNPA